MSSNNSQKMSTDKHCPLKLRKSIKKHRCEFCNKEFMSSSALVIHRRSHTGMRPYKCPFCSRAFSQMTGIQHHIRTHTGERPYMCNICHFKFSRSDSLARHIKKRHSGVQNGLVKRKKKTSSEISKKQLLVGYHNNSHSDPSTSQLTDSSFMLNGFLDVPTELQSSNQGFISDTHLTDDSSKNSHLKFPDGPHPHNKVTDSFIRDKRYMHSRIQSPRLRTKSLDKKYNSSYSFSNCNLPEFRYSEVSHQRISVPQKEISVNNRKNYKSTEETSLPQSKVNKRFNYNPNISYTNDLDNIHFKNVDDISISSEIGSKLHNKLDKYQYANRKIPDSKNGGKYHKCFFCFKCFASKSALNIHKRIHTGIRPYVCKMCGRSFTQKTGLRHHYRTHTQERPYKCSICFYAFARSDSLLRHTKLRHKKLKKKASVYNKQLIKPPECYPNSENFFEKSSNFKQMVLQNENNNLFEKDHLVAKNLNNLDIREYSVRNNTSSSHVSVDSSLLLDPLMTVSDGIRHHIHSTELGNSNLSAGVITNTERPEITCTNSPIYITDDEEEFDISFPEKTENVHAVKSCLKPSTNSKNTTGKYGKKRNLPCNFCHKTFSSYSVLKVHKRIHTGVRPYRCKFCGRSFTQQTGLTHHLRTHTGEKPYSCGNCNAQFSRSDSLARHWRQQHLKQFSIKDNYLKQKNRSKKVHVSSNSADENLSHLSKNVRLSESETNNIQDISDNNSSIGQINFAPVIIKSEVPIDETVPAVICDTSSKDDAGTADKLKTDDFSPAWRRGCSYRDNGNFTNVEIENFQPVSNAFSPSNEPNIQRKCSSCKKVFNDKTLLSSHVCEINTEYQCFLCDMNFNNTILLAEHVSEQHNLKQNCKREGELSQFSFEDEFGSLVEMVITHNNDRDVCRIYLSDFSENNQTIEMNMDEKINQNISDIWDVTENKKLEIPQSTPNDCDSKANIFYQTGYGTGSISNHKDSSEDILQIKLEQDQQELSDVSQNKSSFGSFCVTNQEEELQDAIEPNTNPLGTQTSGISSEASSFVVNGSDAGISIPLLNLNHCKTEDVDSSMAQLNKDYKQTRSKQRQCEFCKKSFNSKWALIIHRRSHTGEKPYECGHCGRGFSQLSGVQHHILTHTGERPFECEICHFRFARSDSLVRHTRLKHSECVKEIGSNETLSSNQSLIRDLRNAYCTDVLDMDKHIERNCTLVEPMLQDKHLINLSEYPLLLSSQVKEPDTQVNIAPNSEDDITLKAVHKEVDFEKDIKNCNMLELPLSPSKDICAKQIKTFDCKFCGSLFTNSDVLLQHLMQCHSNEIILNDIKGTDILPKSGSEQSKNLSQDSLSISESKDILTFHSSNASSFTENCVQRENIFHLLKEYDNGMATENSSTLNREESNTNFNVDLKYIENVETIPLDRLEQNGDGQEMNQNRNPFQNIIDITETDFDLKETSVDEIIKKDVNSNGERNHKDADVGNVEDDNNDDDDDEGDDDDVICITPENFSSSYQMNSLKSFAEDFDVTEQKGYEVSYMSITDNNNISAREITDQSNGSNSCRFCGKSFPTQSALKVHQRTHTGLRPYKCPTCGRAFTQKVGLQHHVRTHTGERPYQCKYCIQKFARSDSLGRHIRHKHLKATKDLNSMSNIQKSHLSPLSLEPDANQEVARNTDNSRVHSNQLESSFIESQEHSSSTNPSQKDFVMMTPNSFGDVFVLEPSDNNVKNNLNECFQDYINYSRLSDDNHIDSQTLGTCDKIEERTQNSSYSIPNTTLLQSSGNTLGNSFDTIVLEEMSINISDSECNSPEQNTTVKYENDLTCDICCKEFSNSHLLIKHLKDHINASKETATNRDKTISAPAPTCYLIDLSDESLEQKTQSELDIDLMESHLLSNITKEKSLENKNATEIREFISRTDPKISTSSLQNLIEDNNQTQLGIEKNNDNYQLVTETENANTTASVLSNLISPNLLPHHTNVVPTDIGDNITCSKTSNNSLVVIKEGTRFKLGHKRHICKYCSKSFASSSALVIHTRTHTGERPYECDYCSRAFSQVTGLRHHIRTHTGYKPYSCHFCYYRFSRSDSLARHLKLEHQKRNKDESSSEKAVDAIQ